MVTKKYYVLIVCCIKKMLFFNYRNIAKSVEIFSKIVKLISGFTP
uniref:Uncharacterized protein n=1 Tax=Anguilla anguilla TaxID=7936 RepID=A0A0E9P8Q2_ANGAN